MPFLTLPFPAFDPVLIQIGPFAIRWYALAYIVGILLGWFYARRLIRNERLWGGPAPLTASRLRRLRAVGDARHHPRRPARLRAVLQSRPFPAAPAGNPAALGRRHVVPRRLRRRVRRHRALCAHARYLDPVARRSHLRLRHRSACSSAASPTSSTASCGAAPPTSPGRWCFRTADRCRVIRASSMKRRSKGWCCSSCALVLHARGRAQASRVW